MCIIVLNYLMSQFLEKSNQSLDSAKYLVKQQYYSSTVNRSYYACFQFLMHILFEKLKKDQAEFYNEVLQRPNGTHTWASKLIGNELARQNIEDYKWFQRVLPEFREKRVKADYYPAVISPDEGELSITRAESIINMLKVNFK